MLKPETNYSSAKELVFDKLDTGSSWRPQAATALARGEMFSDLHLSELAFWPSSSASGEPSTASSSVSRTTDDTEVYIESTANGFNIFKDHVGRRSSRRERVRALLRGLVRDA
jgi:hypothetical protein